MSQASMDEDTVGLKRLRDWKIRSFQDAIEALEYAKSLWNNDCGSWQPEASLPIEGCRLDLNRPVPDARIYMRAVTGGWSDNEMIIYAMHDNFLLWTMVWESSHRGGMYRFRLSEDG